ncbi:MAG: polyprenyl synthetase family protein [Azospirillaceae bacterium]
MNKVVSLPLADAMAEAREDITRTLDHLLPKPVDSEARLHEAMRYATLGAGKRLRPFLVLASATLFSVGRRTALRVAAAVECVHCYSLVHDDLPAMDDDELRRGRPTVHVAFDEATAILAGDALLAFAFEILADQETHPDPKVRCELVARLARAAGPNGMVAGQMIDLEAEQRSVDIGGVTRLQRLKTGELFAFACEAGAILARVDSTRRHALHAFAHDLGLAFQIADDLLDVTGREEETGKKVDKDRIAGKATFVSILGVERARDQASLLADQAIRHLEIFDERADTLRQIARFVIERRH